MSSGDRSESVFKSYSAGMDSNIAIDGSVGQNNIVDIGIAYGQSLVIPEQYSKSSSSFAS